MEAKEGDGLFTVETFEAGTYKALLRMPIVRRYCFAPLGYFYMGILCFAYWLICFFSRDGSLE